MPFVCGHSLHALLVNKCVMKKMSKHVYISCYNQTKSSANLAHQAHPVHRAIIRGVKVEFNAYLLILKNIF